MPIVHHPLAYSIGPFPITGFGLAVLLAFVGGQIIAQHETRRRGYDPEPVGDVVFASVIGFLIGAKLYYAFVVAHDWHTLLSRGGFVFWGGFIGATAGGMWMGRRRGFTINCISDICAIGVGAGYSIGRTGCWAVGDDYGRPWTSAWAVAFPEGAPPSTALNLQRDFGIPIPPGVSPLTVMSVIPTQLIEVVLGFAMFLILWRFRKHAHAEGWLFGLYLALAGVERFAVEFLRAKDDRYVGGLTLAQAIAVGIFTTGVIWMSVRWRITSTAPGIYRSASAAGG